LNHLVIKKKKKFLRFICGREKLPPVLTSNFVIQEFQTFGDEEYVDNYLPVSHTCSFALELPEYSTKEILREKLLYAITYCRNIDLDGDN